MGYQVYDDIKGRPLRMAGYCVPAICDYPGCNVEIHRGLAHMCGGDGNEEEGCGLHFCDEHLGVSPQLCDRCAEGQEPFEPKPDCKEWVSWVLTDESWANWPDRAEYAKKYGWPPETEEKTDGLY